MLDDSIFLFLYSKTFLGFSILPVVFSRPYFSVLSTKVSQDLTCLWLMSRTMDETSKFWSIPEMIYITFSVLFSAITHLVVSSWWGGLSSHFPAETSMVGIYPSRFFIRWFYNTFINRFYYLHAFKYVYIFLTSNGFIIKTLHIRLPAPSVWHVVQQYFIQFCLTIFFTWLCSRENSQILIKINHKSSIVS